MPERQPTLINPGDHVVFIVSDGTGITAETFSHAVLAQFESVRFKQLRMPFIDNQDKAHQAVIRINDAGNKSGKRPILFSTLANPDLAAILKTAHALHMDLFQTFVGPLEEELQVKSTHSIGRGHQVADTQEYKDRIEAINFSLAHDDGQSSKDLLQSDVILVGVSRSGKTPTSLYLAMQYGIKAANCPLIPEDFERGTLPSAIKPYRDKLFGLSIQPERLSEIRNERRPGSKYANLDNCRYEVAEAERLMRTEGIRWCNSTTKSIEEIATTLLNDLQLERRAY
jgi:[pyruvate, water dikinase]-phosphate phosphotransferase / [pyruvate, water dikinase] kinase